MYDFTTEANCIGIDVEMFFVSDGGTQYKEAPLLKRTCNNCVVKNECLEYSLHHAVVGWWGGTSEKERTEIRRRRNISPEPVLVTEKWIV